MILGITNKKQSLTPCTEQGSSNHDACTKPNLYATLPAVGTRSEALCTEELSLIRGRGRFSEDNSSGFFLLDIAGTLLMKFDEVCMAPVLSSKKPSPPKLLPSGEESLGLILLTILGIVLCSGVVITPCLWVFVTKLNTLLFEFKGVTALSDIDDVLPNFSLKLKVLWLGVLIVDAFGV